MWGLNMANGKGVRTGPFLVRGSVSKATGAGFAQAEIDLGSYVDALGEAVLKIHSIQVCHQETANPEKGPVSASSGVTLNYGYQLTTQSQSALVLSSDRSVIASGSTVTPKQSTTASIQGVFDVNNLNPSFYQDGVLIATQTLYLGVENDVTMDDACTTTVIMECSVQPLDNREALALALGQQ
jgi:hypothetical protein